MNYLIIVVAIFSAFFSASYADDDDVCFLEKAVGSCEAQIPRYYYNATIGECETFNYGGCQGNGNNFETCEECIKECGGHVCSLPKDSGLCLALIIRYYFDEETGTCEEFTYGGCDGNANNFCTPEECYERCG